MSLHGSPFFIESFAKELASELEGDSLYEVFSSSKEDIFFIFSNLNLKVHFFKGEAFFSIIEDQLLPKRGRLPQFKDLHKQVVEKLNTYHLDRGFSIHFNNDRWIAFKLYGKRANIIKGSGDTSEEVFRSQLKADANFSLDKLHDHELKIGSVKFAPKEEVTHDHPFLRGPVTELLYPDNTEDPEIFSKVITALEKPVWGFEANTDKGIELLNLKANYTTSDSKPILGWITDFSKEWLRIHRFADRQKEAKQFFDKKLHQLRSRHAQRSEALARFEGTSKYKTYADLIMANLYRIESGVKSVDLEAFDTGETITIPLKKDESPQKNAERFYRKAKNEHIEQELLQTDIDRIEKEISLIEKELIRTEEAKFISDLPAINKRSEKTNADSSLPYWVEEFNGFDIWIGKNASSNDVVLQRTSKNDLWFHAKDTTGSHVVIRNPENKNIPEFIIEAVASVAAGYSKKKSEGLCAVSYTERKYVRKFKGAKPGQVIVEREKVVLVPPKRGFNP